MMNFNFEYISPTVWCKKINHFNSSDQNFLFYTHFRELWGFSMDGCEFIRVYWTPLVNRFT